MPGEPRLTHLRRRVLETMADNKSHSATELTRRLMLQRRHGVVATLNLFLRHQYIRAAGTPVRVVGARMEYAYVLTDSGRTVALNLEAGQHK